MPTLTWLDSFYHRSVSATYYGTAAGIYDITNTPGVMASVAGRRSDSVALEVAENGTNACQVVKQLPAGNRHLVESFYFKVSAKPSSDSSIWNGNAGGLANVGMQTGTGFLFAVTAGGTQRTGAIDYSDGAWHRMDVHWDTTANPFKLDVQVDGVALTQATGSNAAADITAGKLGTSNTAGTLTCQYADWVRSVTSGDYPIGDHVVVPLVVNADGTHNWASTNMGDETGGRLQSVTDLWTKVDEPASGAAPNTSDYVAYTNTTATATEYAELLMPDAALGATIWAARAIAAIFSSGTAANAATTRVVDGANATVLDLYVGDQSDTSNRYQASLLPGVATPAALNALKWRVGFPTDSSPAPRWSMLMVDYAAPGNGEGTASPAQVAGTGAVPAPTAKGDGVASPAAVAGVGAVPAPTATGGTGAVDGTATPGTVAGVGSVPAPTAQGAAAAAVPAATAGVGSVPAPSPSGLAVAAPVAVAGVGSVPAPTAQGSATASPAQVAGTGAVPPPTGLGTATASPATVAGVGSVPAPSATGASAGTALPAAVAGVGSVPAPTGQGSASTSPATVAGVGSVPAAVGRGGGTGSPAATAGVGAVPAPSASGVSFAAPLAVAGLGAVPAPTARGNATANPGATEGIGAVPDPTALSQLPGIASPDTVAGVGDVPAPTVFGAVRALPGVVIGIGAVPTPTGRGDANAYPQAPGGDEFSDEFSDEFGGGMTWGPTAGIGAVPAPNVTGQGEPQQQHDFDPGRKGPRFTARAVRGWRGTTKEPALSGRASTEGGG